MVKQKAKNKKGMVVIYFLFILIPFIWFFFLNNGSDHSNAAEVLSGKWQRADGPYTIHIMSVNEDGTIDLAYFNPNPIPGAKGSWKMRDDKLTVFVILNDASYKGSTYELTYNERSSNLVGIFYQAIVKQTFDVYFSKTD